MTRWLGCSPQSKLIWNLFDNHAEETELLVIGEGQKESLFCFAFLFLPSFNPEPHNLSLKAEEFSARTDLEQSRRKRQRKRALLSYFFSLRHSLWLLCCPVDEANKRLGLKLQIRICTCLTQLWQRARGNQTGIRSWSLHDA